MPIELIDKIKPKNGQGFPLVEAEDVEMPDGTRLSKFSPQIQTDYSQNDSTAKDYIKNRPFYEGEPILTEFPLRETALEKQTLDRFALDSSLNAYVVGQFDWFSIQEGESYIVHWDGMDYPVTAYATVANGYDTIALGNEKLMKGESTEIEEPFVVASVTANGYRMIVAVADTEATPHDVAIYKEPVFAYEESSSGFVSYITISPEQLEFWNDNDWQSCKVVLDGVEYVCEPKMLSGVIKCIGNTEKLTGTGDSGEPFVIACLGSDINGTNDNIMVIQDLETPITDATQEGDTVEHEIDLFVNQPNIKKIDPKFLENIDYETQLINKPFGTIPSGTVLFDETVVCSETGKAYVDSIELVEGITYTVEFDGTVYTAVATSPEENTIYLSLDAENDYMIVCANGMTVIVYSEGEHTVKITLAEDVVKKIDEIYLPDDLGGSGLPEVTTDDNDKIIQVVDGAYQVVALENSAVKTYIDNYINEALGGEY